MVQFSIMFSSQGIRKVLRFVHKREALSTDMPNDKLTFFSRNTFVTVAQLVERLIGDREMSGSSPPPLTILFHANFGFLTTCLSILTIFTDNL